MLNPFKRVASLFKWGAASSKPEEPVLQTQNPAHPRVYPSLDHDLPSTRPRAHFASGDLAPSAGPEVHPWYASAAGSTVEPVAMDSTPDDTPSDYARLGRQLSQIAAAPDPEPDLGPTIAFPVLDFSSRSPSLSGTSGPGSGPAHTASSRASLTADSKHTEAQHRKRKRSPEAAASIAAQVGSKRPREPEAPTIDGEPEAKIGPGTGTGVGAGSVADTLQSPARKRPRKGPTAMFNSSAPLSVAPTSPILFPSAPPPVTGLKGLAPTSDDEDLDADHEASLRAGRIRKRDEAVKHMRQARKDALSGAGSADEPGRRPSRQGIKLATRGQTHAREPVPGRTRLPPATAGPAPSQVFSAQGVAGAGLDSGLDAGFGTGLQTHPGPGASSSGFSDDADKDLAAGMLKTRIRMQDSRGKTEREKEIAREQLRAQRQQASQTRRIERIRQGRNHDDEDDDSDARGPDACAIVGSSEHKAEVPSQAQRAPLFQWSDEPSTGPRPDATGAKPPSLLRPGSLGLGSRPEATDAKPPLTRPGSRFDAKEVDTPAKHKDQELEAAQYASLEAERRAQQARQAYEARLAERERFERQEQARLEQVRLRNQQQQREAERAAQNEREAESLREAESERVRQALAAQQQQQRREHEAREIRERAQRQKEQQRETQRQKEQQQAEARRRQEQEREQRTKTAQERKAPVNVPAPAADTSLDESVEIEPEQALAPGEVLTADDLKRRIEDNKRRAQQNVKSRVRQRKREMSQQEQQEQKEHEERLRLQEELGPAIRRRVAHLSYIQLCKEFNPKCRLPPAADHDATRRTLRTTMAKYHPDRARHLATMRERVEAEEIFEALKNAYEELCQML